MSPAHEKEFFHLASWWMACRLQVMGGFALGSKHKPDVGFDLLGVLDYQEELKLLCAEVRSSFSAVASFSTAASVDKGTPAVSLFQAFSLPSGVEP